mgnify:CR=1 FL=1
MHTLLQENEDFFQRKDLDLYFLPRIELEEGQMFKVPINQMMEAIFLPHLEDKLPFNFFSKHKNFFPTFDNFNAIYVCISMNVSF